MAKENMCTRGFKVKAFVTIVALLISVQYLVNIIIHQRSDGVFLWFYETGSSRNTSDIIALKYLRANVTEKPPQPECPIIPPGLRGRITANTQIAAWAFIEEQNPKLEPGGYYKPPDCSARSRVAIIIPYRDREVHLKIFLQNIHPFLQRQQLEYRIFVVEMANDVKFNRALLMNVGFVEAMKLHDFQCFIFHDVDLLPEDDRNLYTCPPLPRHMSVAIDRLKYRLPYAQIFGGVSALLKEHFIKVNGFSNLYFGWGGEDDDMYRRISLSNLTVTRYATNVARYKMLVHKKDTGNPQRFVLLKSVKARQRTDGLSSLKYEVLGLENRRLYTWICISVNMTQILQDEPIHKLSARRVAPGALVNKQIKPNIQGQNKKPNQKLNQPSKAVKSISQPKFKVPKKPNSLTINWVPPDFKGKLPENLTKFDIEPPAGPPGAGKMSSKQLQQKLAQQKLAREQNRKMLQIRLQELKLKNEQLRQQQHKQHNVAKQIQQQQQNVAEQTQQQQKENVAEEIRQQQQQQVADQIKQQQQQQQKVTEKIQQHQEIIQETQDQQKTNDEVQQLNQVQQQ